MHNSRVPRCRTSRAGLSRRGVWSAILEWGRASRKGASPLEIRRSLPGDAIDVQARYVEAAVLGTC